jgi:uncharacterized protein YndB with AHSA1/START domain
MERDNYAGVSSEAVQAKTGKTWPEWFAALDAAGAQTLPHPQIARYLQEVHGVPDWWCQMVTVGYEQARGLREAHQKTDGFTANASKTLGVPLAVLYDAWAAESQRAAWLGETGLTVRKATPGKSLRITWSDGSAVDVGFYAKGEAKSQVSLQHAKLPDAESGARMKTFWSAALDRLKAFVEGQTGS